jgi:hypothetical protein
MAGLPPEMDKRVVREYLKSGCLDHCKALKPYVKSTNQYFGALHARWGIKNGLGRYRPDCIDTALNTTMNAENSDTLLRYSNY